MGAQVPKRAVRFAMRSHETYALFSFHGNESSHKYGLVDAVHKNIKSLRREGLHTQDGLVVLASRQYASWLQDNDFMSTLLEPFVSRDRAKVKNQLSVLAAAVDGLHPLRAMGDVPHGFSFFYGCASRMMPDFWTDGPRPKPVRESKLQAAITFQSKMAGDDALNVDCTVPLANTIFQNGLQSTMLASFWRRPKPKMPLMQVHAAEMQSQAVTYWYPKRVNDTWVESPLVPITVPRKILRGLGNIVSQIEVDGKETPASAELEIAVNERYARHTEKGHESPPGPVGVWAMVLPPGPRQPFGLEVLKNKAEDLSLIQTPYDEWVKALEFKDSVRKLLRDGAKVYRILSGGGGWGKKQGLLSLDPETTYSPSSEEDDLDSFIRSFENRHNGGADQGVVAPGAYIQYFVTPPRRARPNPPRPDGATLSFAFGASSGAMSEKPPSDDYNKPAEWKLVPEHFGAVSNHGLFVKVKTKRTKVINESKLDVPGTWVGYGKQVNP